MTCMNIRPGDFNLIKTKFFRKGVTSNGLVLEIQAPRCKPKKTRFVHAAFSNAGDVLAATDLSGTVLVVDLLASKHWNFKTANPCTIIRFSVWNDNEILAGFEDGSVGIINVHTALRSGALIGHDHPVSAISFSHRDFLCLTSSRRQAIMWDLKTNSKRQILTLRQDCILKLVLFVPITNDILTCFHDNVIQVWKCDTFEGSRTIDPTLWNSFPVRVIAFTRNGRAALIAGLSSSIAVFALESWNLIEIIQLPQFVQSVRQLIFVPQLFDGGCNRVLGILSGNGILYFYDMERHMVFYKIAWICEILNFAVSSDGKFIAIVLCLGKIEVYDATTLLKIQCDYGKVEQNVRAGQLSLKAYKRTQKAEELRKQQADILDEDKIRGILKEFGEYPSKHRQKIWASLLQLPNNKDFYTSIINRVQEYSLDDLIEKYPLENRASLNKLKLTMSNLIRWCPMLSYVKYLPALAFPFVKAFDNNPIVRFELLCSILVNWCQHWFEYFPLPPVNVFAMIENLFIEHDTELFNHLSCHNMTAKEYAWPLLQTAFSEVLTTSQWYILWDHILTNEPAFILIAIVAYGIVSRSILLSMSETNIMTEFYHQQNPINIKRLISKSYVILHKTTPKNHPRLYLKPFCFHSNPCLLKFPKALLEYEQNKLVPFAKVEQELKNCEDNICRKRLEFQEKIKDFNVINEEEARLQEMEKACCKQIMEEEKRIKDEYERLLGMEKEFQQEEIATMCVFTNKMKENNIKQNQRKLQRLLDDLERNQAVEDLRSKQVETDLLRHYASLLKYKMQMQELLEQNTQISSDTIDKHVTLCKERDQFLKKLEKIKMRVTTKSDLKQIGETVKLTLIDNLIQRVEVALAKEMAERYQCFNQAATDNKVSQLESETKDLETEVGKLLAVLAQSKMKECEDKIGKIHTSMTERSAVQFSPKSPRRNTNLVQIKTHVVENLERNLDSLKVQMKNTRFSGKVPPSSPN